MDQYALAVTAYQALSGRVPFDGTSFLEIIKKKLLGKIPPLHELVPTLPRSLTQVIEKGLSQEPKERYATCAAFANAVLATVKAVHGNATRVRNAVCPACKKSFALPTDPAGKSVKCPACGAGFMVLKKPAKPTAAKPNATPVAAPTSLAKTYRNLVIGVGAAVLALLVLPGAYGLYLIWKQDDAAKRLQEKTEDLNQAMDKFSTKAK